ncbi:UNVERIFIED_CONTAM: hypothetical protein Scaly_1198400 [Sesamum calycinum]|uniref:Uncharacterized protein n=1 Tax=Sesamum calycinum TaxID=2727403 RepID=A0AAW2Q420_9LAMI
MKRRIPFHTGVMRGGWIGHRGWFFIPSGRISDLIIARMVRLMMERDRFYNIVHVVEQPLLKGCTQSQLASVANTKKLIRDLGLPVEKIDVCKNDRMLYWKDDIDLYYCNFYGEARYKPTRERNPYCKKTLYGILSHLSLTPCLQRLYVSEATAEQMTCHANHQTEDGSMCHPSDAEA